MLSARFMYFMNGSLVQQVIVLKNTTWGYIYVMEDIFLKWYFTTGTTIVTN